MAREPEKLNPAVLALGWVSFLTDVSSEMIYPLLPAFLTRTLSAGPEALGLIEGVAEATASLTKILSGWWSDRSRRRKPLVLAGYALAAVARPLVGLATAWTQVLAIRFADRVGKGIRTSPRDALVADLTPPEKRGRAFGLQRAMDNAGGFVGPLVAAFLLRFVWDNERSVFLAAAVPGVAALFLLAWGVPEAARPTPRRTCRENSRARRCRAGSGSPSGSSLSSLSRLRPTRSFSCAPATWAWRSGNSPFSGPSSTGSRPFWDSRAACSPTASAAPRRSRSAGRSTRSRISGLRSPRPRPTSGRSSPSTRSSSP